MMIIFMLLGFIFSPMAWASHGSNLGSRIKEERQ